MYQLIDEFDSMSPVRTERWDDKQKQTRNTYTTNRRTETEVTSSCATAYKGYKDVTDV